MEERKLFNFNNEVDTFEVLVDSETGVVTVPGENGEPIATYDSMQQFAEIYAQARDVKPEHLKNWVLVEQGDVYSFVLRAGTAGVAYQDVRETVNEVLTALEAENFAHPLQMAQFRNSVNAWTNDTDVMNALAVSTMPDIAREVYDRLAEAGAFNPPAPEPTPLEAFLQDMKERHGNLIFFAWRAGMAAESWVSATVDEVKAALEAGPVPVTPEGLYADYQQTITSIQNNNIGVNTDEEALLVLTQSNVDTAEDSEKAKSQISVSARLAGRNKVNLPVYTVGRRNIKKTNELRTLDELPEVHFVNRIPTVVVFDPSVDEVLEAEAAEAAAVTLAPVNNYGYGETDYDEDYDEDEEF